MEIKEDTPKRNVDIIKGHNIPTNSHYIIILMKIVGFGVWMP
jgi:hypothetical protein